MKELGKHLLGGATIVVAIVLLLKLLYAAPQLDDLTPVEASDATVSQTSNKLILKRLPASVEGPSGIEVKKKTNQGAINSETEEIPRPPEENRSEKEVFLAPYQPETSLYTTNWLTNTLGDFGWATSSKSEFMKAPSAVSGAKLGRGGSLGLSGESINNTSPSILIFKVEPGSSVSSASDNGSSLGGTAIATPTPTPTTTPIPTATPLVCGVGTHDEAGSCISDTKTATCTGALVANSSWYSTNLYTKSWNGSSYIPATLTATQSYTSTACGFYCNAGYYWLDGICIETTPVILSLTSPTTVTGEGSGSHDFVLSLSATLALPLTVVYNLTSSDALSGTHYTGLPAYFTIPAGELTATVTISALDDILLEREKSLQVNLERTNLYFVQFAQTDKVRIIFEENDKPNVIQVSTGDGHSCAIDGGGLLRCWGTNDYGQLGDGTNTNQTLPTLVSTTEKFSQIAVGYYWTCAITRSGALYCWGGNGGTIGDGTETDRWTPVLIDGGTTYKEIATGFASNHTCGITNTNVLKCWGQNSNGQLGDGTLTARLSPTVIGSDYRRVALGMNHTCAIKTNGEIFCWGKNTRGQLGINSTV